MRFCQAFMLELHRNIGEDCDVPAGDIGVGGREVGYMFGAYKKYTRQFTGVLTGKGREFGGSLIRPEATGYGNVYFLMEMLRTRGTDLQGKTVLISGSGNVAQYTAEKVLELGGKVLTMSDSDGFVYDPDGIDREKLDYIMELKNLYRGPQFANMPRSIPRHNTSRGRNLGASRPTSPCLRPRKTNSTANTHRCCSTTA